MISQKVWVQLTVVVTLMLKSTNLSNKALATVDADARGKLLAEATEKAVGENYGVIPMHYQVNTWAAKKGYSYLPRTDERTIVTGLSGS